MSYGWIDAKQFSFNTLLLMDRWLFRQIAKNRKPEFQKNLAIALSGNPVVYWYAVNKCPESQKYFAELVSTAPTGCSKEEIRNAEVFVLDALDWAVVYVYPEIMENLPYIKDWSEGRLLEMADFRGKTVLDIGAGTGRLAFAAAPLAKAVYASEPVDRLGEHMREKAKRLKANNVWVLDGTIEALPFEDKSFDIVMSGHVFGDDYDAEYQEMSRVTKPGGWIIDCPGGGPGKRTLSEKLVTLGFEYTHYLSKAGGDVYRYWKQI